MLTDVAQSVMAPVISNKVMALRVTNRLNRLVNRRYSPCCGIPISQKGLNLTFIESKLAHLTIYDALRLQNSHTYHTSFRCIVVLQKSFAQSSPLACNSHATTSRRLKRLSFIRHRETSLRVVRLKSKRLLVVIFYIFRAFVIFS